MARITAKKTVTAAKKPTRKPAAKKPAKKPRIALREAPAGLFQRDDSEPPPGSQVIEATGLPLAVTPGMGGKAITLAQWRNLWADNEGMSDDMPAGLLRKSPWAFRCVEINAKSLAAIPWKLFEGEKEVTSGPYWDLLRNVNDDANWQDLVAETGADLDVFGMAYWLKVRVGRRVKFLLRLNPATIKVVANNKGVQHFQQKGANGKKYTRKDLLWFKLYDPLNDFGAISPLMACANAIRAEAEADEHLREFFENHAMPDYIISLETTNPKELQRLSDQWSKDFSGSGNRHKVGWIGGGGTPKEIGYAPENLALEVIRAEFRRQICAAFGVPPALVGAWEAANYATIREQRQSLYTERLLPLARYIEGVINAELSPEFGQEFRWMPENLPALADNENDRVKRFAWLVQAQIIKPEVAAEKLGFKAEDVPKPEERISRVNNNFQNESFAPGNDLREDKKVDLAKWQRKAMKRLKEGEAAAVEFESAAIPPFVLASVYDGLQLAKTPEQVKAIFDVAMREDDEMRDVDIAAIIERAIKAAKTDIVIKADNVTMHQDPPIVNVAPPTVILEPRIAVEVPPAVVENKIEVPAPVVNVAVDAKPDLAPIADAVKAREKAQPILKRRHEKQVVERKNGEISGSRSEVEYEYD